MTRRFEDKSDAELVKMHTKGMALVEGTWAEMAERLCRQAGDDRTCAQAVMAGEAREMLKLAEAFHAKADVLAAKYANVPMPRSGDR